MLFAAARLATDGFVVLSPVEELPFGFRWNRFIEVG